MSDSKGSWLREAIVTILSCAFVILVLWSYDSWGRYRHAYENSIPLKPVAKSGDSIKLEGVDFSHSAVSLILVTSPVCQYCKASEHFHSRLLSMGRTANVPVYVAVPARNAASQYLKDLAASDDIVKEYRQMNLSITGTPTILGIDNAGHVRDVWSGMATPADESDIVNVLKSRSFSVKVDTGIEAPDILPQDLANLKQKTPLEVIDVAERERTSLRTGTNNIPLKELPLRANFELDKKKLQVIDCTSVDWSQCNSAVKTLAKMHFNAATSGAGTYHLRCKYTPAT